MIAETPNADGRKTGGPHRSLSGLSDKRRRIGRRPNAKGPAKSNLDDLFDAPADVAKIDVRTSTGLHRYARLKAHAVHCMCALKNGVQLDGWSPGGRY